MTLTLPILEPKTYNLHGLFLEGGESLYEITLPTGEIKGRVVERLSCGCCDDWVEREWDFDDFCDESKQEIIDVLNQHYK